MSVYQPYADERSNHIYNLNFCDALESFFAWNTGSLSPLFEASFDERKVRAIAEDKTIESRIRALAFSRLRENRLSVPQKLLLGVVVETPLPRGLDVMAAYADGRIRYINGAGRRATIEKDAPELRPIRQALLGATQDVVDELQPNSAPRSPPPALGNMRITGVASDGLYVGEANLEALTQDPLGGPIVRATAELSTAVLQYSKAKKR